MLVVLLSLLPKYLLRLNGRHIFNPSNIGLAWGLLLIGPSTVFSEHLWWAPLGAPVLISMAVRIDLMAPRADQRHVTSGVVLR